MIHKDAETPELQQQDRLTAKAGRAPFSPLCIPYADKKTHTRSDKMSALMNTEETL